MQASCDLLSDQGISHPLVPKEGVHGTQHKNTTFPEEFCDVILWFCEKKIN